ncbi:MAG: hypothetical protein P857_378 [Candidatus Xenolissoclinum pacificiensis L6]|uniref:Uncharacterized protein n=1 Tax=Candidatus Xenolissoclinum pacificiensis L6 TaxID=1401685 RepID=W2V1Y4_9RICK|nr:MAG: hypothetical protein P857_378 [Candidatus Xenolissoclinum pacificiensis L6]
MQITKIYRIKCLCTDNYGAYKCYTISNVHHITKSETSLVESKNSSPLSYLF